MSYMSTNFSTEASIHIKELLVIIFLEFANNSPVLLIVIFDHIYLINIKTFYYSGDYWITIILLLKF